MKSKFFKDRKLRKTFCEFELKRRFLKCISRNQKIATKIRWIAQIELDRIGVPGSISKLNSHCLFTNRVRAVDPKLKLSRIQLREFVLNSKLPGMTKAIW